MNIIGATISRLRHSEYVGYMRSYLHVFDKNDPDILGVKNQFDALTAKVDEIEAVHKLDRASSLTEIIADLDIQRDEYLMGISFVIRGYLSHYDASKQQDAKALNTRLDVYGGAAALGRESLQGQTVSLDNLIVDLQDIPALQAAVMSLGLSDWVSQLKIVNDNLRSTYDDRTEEKGQTPSDKIKDLRIEGNDLYYSLRDHLFGHALLAGYAAPYDAVINEINALAVQYNDMLARRSGGSEVDPEDDGGDNDVGQE